LYDFNLRIICTGAFFGPPIISILFFINKNVSGGDVFDSLILKGCIFKLEKMQEKLFCQTNVAGKLLKNYPEFTGNTI